RSPTVVRITRSQDASTRGSFSEDRASAGNVEVFRATLLVAHPPTPSASSAALPFFNRARRSIRSLALYYPELKAMTIKKASNFLWLFCCTLILSNSEGFTQRSPGPEPVQPAAAIAVPRDIPY